MIATGFFVKSPKSWLLSDLFIAFFIAFSLAGFKAQADKVLLFFWGFIFVYLILLRRRSALVHQLIATLLAFGWVHFARDYYGYKVEYITIWGTNSLPLMAWTLTLLGLGEIVYHLKSRKKIHSLLIFVAFFLFFGILFETVAYHQLGLRNTLTGNYPGLPICDCVHAPTWMKAVYFAMGPTYFTATLVVDEAIRKSNGKTEGTGRLEDGETGRRGEDDWVIRT